MIMALSGLTVNPSHGATVEKKILAFGDSLTAGYGIPMEKSFPAQLEAKLKQEGHDVIVINGGVSGDTTSGGLTRLAFMLDQHQPDYVILELGANDMLRGIDYTVARGNLRKMLDILRARKIPTLLAGMRTAPNMSILYQDKYQNMFEALAEEYDVVFYPFFLEGVMLDSNLMQQDGLHPNEAGVARVVENIFEDVEKLIKQ